jgi:hypothetical protein
MSASSIINEAYSVLYHGGTDGIAPSGRLAEEKEDVYLDDPTGVETYDGLIQQVASRTVVDVGVSGTDFIESSAQMAQALVSLDYFSDRFKAEDALAELTQVNKWVEVAARNHSHFLYILESEKRPDDFLHENDELGYIYSLDIENVATFSTVRGEYVTRNRSKFTGITRSCRTQF